MYTVCFCGKGTAVWYQVDVLSITDVLLTSTVYTAVQPLTVQFPNVSVY